MKQLIVLLIFCIGFGVMLKAQEITSPTGELWYKVSDGNKLMYPKGLEAIRFSNDSIYVGNNLHSLIQQKEGGRIEVYNPFSDFTRGYFFINSGEAKIFGYKDDYRGTVNSNGDILNEDSEVIGRSNGVELKLLACFFILAW